MELNGAKFREVRRERGLSQIELSDGICTQATISLIENSNRIPKLEILNQLVDRLDIPVNDILIVDRIDNGLIDQITDSLYRDNMDKVNNLLEEIDPDSLEGEDLTRYYYLMGFNKLRQKLYDDAIYYFGLVLTQFSVSGARHNMWPAVYYGFTNAYYYKGEMDKAQGMADRAMDDLGSFMEVANHNNYGYWLASTVADLQLELGNPNKAKRVCKEIIKVALNKHQLSPLGKAYRVMGKAELVQEDYQAAQEHVTIANSFAKVLKDPEELQATELLLQQINNK